MIPPTTTDSTCRAAGEERSACMALVSCTCRECVDDPSTGAVPADARPARQTSRSFSIEEMSMRQLTDGRFSSWAQAFTAHMTVSDDSMDTSARLSWLTPAFTPAQAPPPLAAAVHRLVVAWPPPADGSSKRRENSASTAPSSSSRPEDEDEGEGET